MDIKLEIKGLDKMVASFKKAPEITTKELNTAIKQSVYEIEREAKPLTPVDTGRLRASYRQEFKQLEGILKIKTNYAFAVHERLKARHKTGQAKFLDKGVEVAKSKIDRHFENALNKIIKQL